MCVYVCECVFVCVNVCARHQPGPPHYYWVVTVVSHIADALYDASQAKYVHMDLKLDNIMIDDATLAAGEDVRQLW